MIYAWDLAHYLSDISCPCTKEQIVAHARQRGAAPEIVNLLERVPERPLHSAADVWTAVGEVS